MQIKLIKVHFNYGKGLFKIVMRTLVFLCCLSVFSFTPNSVLSQSTKIVIDTDKTVTVDEVFKIISTQTDYKFIYQAGLLENFPKVNLKKGTIRVDELLKQTLSNSKVDVVFTKDTIVIKKKNNPLNSQQHIKVNGTVKDQAGLPVPGATVLIKGTSKGVATDLDGHYGITVPVGSTLVFSSLGFETQEVVVGQISEINITLKEAVSELDAVTINAGYYKTSKRTATGSIAKVTAKDIEKQPVTNPMAAISGRMPGVYIQQTTGVPGGDFKIEIRGRNSLRLDGNEPLYIVDGMPFSTERVSAQTTGAQLLGDGGVRPLTSINSADIESIEILKDSDATAIYGSRGANGVVLITTKKGKAGKTKIDVNYYSGYANVHQQKLLNTEQYLAMRREAFANDNLIPSSDPGDTNGQNGKGYAPDLTIWDQNRYTDWQKVFIGKTAITNSFQASVSGGTEQTQFLMSAGYYNEGSVFPGEHKFQKLSSHLSLNHTSENGKFFVNVSISGSRDKHDQPREDFSFTPLWLAPNAPKLYNENGTINWEYHPVTGQATWDNPIAKLEATYEGKVNNLISKMTIGFKIIEGLKIQSSFGYNRLTAEEISFYPSTQYPPGSGVVSGVNASNGRTNSWILEPQINWDRKIVKGHLSFLVGATYQEQDHKLLAIDYFHFPSNALLRDLSAAANQNTNKYTASIYKYAALYGRINYNWDGKYIVNLTGRSDGSSRFGPGRQYANFGAIGAAWVFSNENFIKNKLPFLSFGKLRGSIGVTGNDQIGNYQFLDTYQAPENTNSYDGVTALDPTRLYNPVFGWETNKKMEAAVELGLLDDKIMLTLGYYHNRSSNQLVNYTLPATTGFNGIQANLGATVQNTGIEVEMKTDNIKSNEFGWTTSFNFTVPKNKLISFPNLESSTYSNTYIVGESIYIQKFYEYTGVDPQTGFYTARDYNNDGRISRDGDAKKAMFVGQDFYGGINNTITYKGLALDVFLQVVGQKGIAPTFPNGYLNFNFPAEWLKDVWMMPGDNATTQRSATEITQGIAGEGALSYYNGSDAKVVDASFIRLKTVSISYQFPKNLMKGISQFMVYLRGQNLGVLTNYKGSDPETQSLHRLAPLRTITLGINLTF